MNIKKKDIFVFISLLVSLIAIIAACYAVFCQYHQVSINKEAIAKIENKLELEIHKIRQELGISYSMLFASKKYITHGIPQENIDYVNNYFNEISKIIRSGEIDKLKLYYSPTYTKAHDEIDKWKMFSHKDIYFSVDDIIIMDNDKILTEVTSVIIQTGQKWGFICVLKKTSSGKWLITK